METTITVGGITIIINRNGGQTIITLGEVMETTIISRSGGPTIIILGGVTVTTTTNQNGAQTAAGGETTNRNGKQAITMR